MHPHALIFRISLRLLLLAGAVPLVAQPSAVQVAGAMRQTMWHGQLAGTIDLDTLRSRAHLFGLGPAEYLAGELLVIDGRSYRAEVRSDTSMQVEETFQAKAPFFVYAQVPAWQARPLPDSVRTLRQLEAYLDRITADARRPFAFRLAGMVDSAVIHLVNLPPGAQVRSPREAHQGLQTYRIPAAEAEMVGFFSTRHQGVFTHHDTFLHLHLITADRSRMGHLDEAWFRSGAVQLLLPAE